VSRTLLLLAAPWLGTKRHGLGTPASQTRARSAGIVNAEGGGTTSPTLGGGYRVIFRIGASPGDTA
jgi:hypothetical protein